MSGAPGVPGVLEGRLLWSVREDGGLTGTFPGVPSFGDYDREILSNRRAPSQPTEPAFKQPRRPGTRREDRRCP